MPDLVRVHDAELGSEPDSAEHRLDLSQLLSPERPLWLDGGADAFRLPFGDGAIEHAVVGVDVLRPAGLSECFAELSRVLSRGGDIEFVLTGTDGSPDQPALDELLIETVRVFRVATIRASRDRVVITARNDRGRGGSDEVDLFALARASAAQATELRDMAADYARTITDMADRHTLTLRDLTSAQDQIDRQRREIAASRAARERIQRSLESVRSAAESQRRAAQDAAAKVNADLAAVRQDVRVARWRVKVAEGRKANRIAEQLKRLRKPWLLPEVAFRSARIAISPPLDIPRPSTPAAATTPASKPRTVKIDAVEFPIAPPRRTDVLVATILDEFSDLAFRYEFDLLPVPREGWREVFDKRRPDILLVESAWNGNGGAWKYAFTGEEVPKRAVLDVLEYCRAHGIPTVFWNKEDPLEYDLFIRSARHFDWVFTVDENCVERYKAELGHDRVAVLPFGVQPWIHNPVGAFKSRSGQVAFAGTYYSGKYPERMQQIDDLLKPAADLGLDIYSRFESDPKYRFPEELAKNVVDSLSYAQTLGAYKQYNVFLNVNSVTDSPTMFSRRVLELLACGTPVVSGPSVGMDAMLGTGTVHQSTDPETSRLLVRSLLASSELRDRMAVKGIRAVMTGNTYSDRVDHLLTTVGLPTTPRRRRVSVIASTIRTGAFDHILDYIAAQEHDDVELMLGLHGVKDDRGYVEARAHEKGVTDLQILESPYEMSLGEVLNELIDAATGDYIAKMDDDDLYGPHYLSDQLLAFDYTEADIVGKWSRYVLIEGVPCLGILFPGSEHRYVELVGGNTILAKRSVFDAVRFEHRSLGEDTQFLRACAAVGFRTYSTDRFNHVYIRSGEPGAHTFQPHALHHLSNSRVVSVGTGVEQAFI